MTKGTKKKVKRSFALFNFSIVLFSFSVLLYLTSALFLRSYNNSISTRAQELSQEIATLELQNDAVEVEIAQLTSADRIDEIASNNGLTRNSGNVISIINGESGE